MEYLITGGSGFIGTSIRRLLHEHSVGILDLVRPINIESNEEFFHADVCDTSELSSILRQYSPHTIIHLAGAHADTGISSGDYYAQNQGGMESLCLAASSVKTILFFSSVAVYGDVAKPADESHTLSPRTPYGRSKLAAEHCLVAWANANEVRQAIILRPTLVYGPGNHANMYRLIEQIDRYGFLLLGGAHTVKSIAYVDNVAQAAVFLLNHAPSRISQFNYTDSPQLTVRELSNILSRLLGRSSFLRIPLPLALLGASGFDLISYFTHKPLSISRARVRKLAQPTHFEASWLNDYGFVPSIGNVEGLKNMVEWYKSEKG